MKHLIKILFIAIVFSQTTFAQTITKTASKNNVQIGEEFYYTIRVTGFNNLSDLDKIKDDFGQNIDYIGVDLSSMSLFQNPLFCSNMQASSPGNIFTLDFTNCNGNAVGNFSSFSFKIKVKLNALACDSSEYTNEASLFLTNGNIIKSNISTIKIVKDDPFKLQKTFRNYDNQNKLLTYDIRLSSSTNNFDFLDFTSNPTFTDTFTIPSCYIIDPIANANQKVVFVPNENNLSITNPVISNVSHTGNNLTIDWKLDPSFRNRTSILYQVIIKLESCTCVNTLFDLDNSVNFNGKDICGKDIIKKAEAKVPFSSCTPELDSNGNPIGSGGSTGIGNPSIPNPIIDSLKVYKMVQLDGNDLNLTMKGCKGKYTIKIINSSGRLSYTNFSLTDLLPTELDINGTIIVTGNATFNQNNNSVTVNSSGIINPDDFVTIEIPFEVNTPLENVLIQNCASIKVNGIDRTVPFTIKRDFCSPFITTVPNTVAIHTSKTICNPPERNCGLDTIYSNLPGDEVEYALHFYNYGTVEARNINVVDFLPANFTIQNINRDVKIYRKPSGINEDVCGDLSSFRDITSFVTKSYNATTNKLDLIFDTRYKLDDFTCKGVTNYIVKIKVKINNNAPNGTYENQFLVYYNDASLNIQDVVASNIVSSTVNVDNLIIGNKSVKTTTQNCKDKTVTATYRIVLANMGIMPVFVDIEDDLTIPSPITIMGSGIYDIKICSALGSNSCTPVATVGIPTTSTPKSFNINGFRLNPCNIIIIEYKANFNTNLLSNGQKLEVCNNARVRTYIKDKNSKSKTVFTADDSLIENYLTAKTDSERLEAINVIKATKENPEILKNRNPQKFSNDSNEFKKNSNYDFGTETIGSKCIIMTDCVNGAGNGCFTSSSSSLDFQITGMNNSGEITTSLTNLSKKITKIEYILTDIRKITTCEDEEFYYRGKKFIKNCLGCSENVMGLFSTTNTNPIGMLNYINQPSILGNYIESNKVVFTGTPSLITQDNRTFKFPVNVNCNGTFEFTITAIVHFEDCSVCYATAAYDYNAYHRFIIQTHANPVLIGTR